MDNMDIAGDNYIEEETSVLLETIAPIEIGIEVPIETTISNATLDEAISVESVTGPVENLVTYFNPFLPWLLLVLLLNRKKWKRSIIYILIACWFFNYASDLSYYSSVLYMYNEKLSYCLDYSLEFVSEIIGDWYLLLRTKAITGNKKITAVYITCLLYNLTKINAIIFVSMENVPDYNDHKYYTKYALIILVIQIFSVFYDVANIYYLRKNIFNKYKNKPSITKNSFIEKLKNVSEFRLIVSLVLSLLTILLFLLSFLSSYYLYKTGKYELDEMIDCISMGYRQAYFNYYFMFIDQILLRFYAERKNPKYKMTSTNSFMFREEIKMNPNENPFTNKPFDINNCPNSERYLYNLSVLDSDSIKDNTLINKSSLDNLTDSLLKKG